MVRWVIAAAALMLPAGAAAQAFREPTPPRQFTEAEIAAIDAPAMGFAETPEVVEAYDKYFYFHRAATSMDDAYADLRECDAMASGISFYAGGSPVYTPYGGVLGGAIGGAVGSLIADAIFGSAQRRQIRRINLRNCMGFKGYQRYGMSRDIWGKLDFAEGNSRKSEDVRTEFLLKQAKVASGPTPQTKVLEP